MCALCLVCQHPLIRDPSNIFIFPFGICFCCHVDWVSSVDIWPVRFGVTDTCLCLVRLCGDTGALFGFAESGSYSVWTFGVMGTHFWLCGRFPRFGFAVSGFARRFPLVGWCVSCLLCSL